jgi:hypothetical protein
MRRPHRTAHLPDSQAPLLHCASSVQASPSRRGAAFDAARSHVPRAPQTPSGPHWSDVAHLSPSPRTAAHWPRWQTPAHTGWSRSTSCRTNEASESTAAAHLEPSASGGAHLPGVATPKPKHDSPRVHSRFERHTSPLPRAPTRIPAQAPGTSPPQSQCFASSSTADLQVASEPSSSKRAPFRKAAPRVRTHSAVGTKGVKELEGQHVFRLASHLS